MRKIKTNFEDHGLQETPKDICLSATLRTCVVVWQIPGRGVVVQN
jgi:hypothetical protein